MKPKLSPLTHIIFHLLNELFREESRVINAAPKNLDQEMPKKLRMLVKAQKEAAVVEKLSNSQKKARQLGEMPMTRSISTTYKRSNNNVHGFVS